MARLSPRIGALVALLTATLLACATAPTAEPARGGLLVLWEVAAPRPTAGTAHLLGSIHVGSGEQGFDPAIGRAFAEADALVVEVPPEDLDPVRTAEVLLQLGRLEDGRTIRDVVGPERWAALEGDLEGHGMAADGFLHMKPWVLLLTLANRQLAQQGYVADQGIDGHFLRRAAGEKPVLGLESVESQLAVFDSLPLDLQVEALEEMLQEDAAVASFDPAELFAAWEDGDLVRLEALLLEEMGADERLDAFYDAMYLRRNEHMARGIARLIDGGGNYFVVVGAGHMVGERSIPTLLADLGYRVRRLPRTELR